MATNTSTTTSTNSLPPPSSPMFTETLINKICCSIINRLLGALHCFSPPVGDLHELDDGVVLVELIESFEEAIFVRYPQLINSNSPQNNSQKPFRNALSRTGSRSNMEYVEQWLMLEGVNLDPKRSIREIFAEIRRSSQELATFLSTFSEDDLTDNSSSLGTMLQKQRVAIYARSIAYISALCYAIFTIFLKHDEQFKRLIPGFRFTVEPDELLHILFYTKWKLTEEELLIKDLEFMRLKDSADLLEIENRRLKGLKGGNDSDNRVPQPNTSNSEFSSYQQQQQQQNSSAGQTPYPQQQIMNSTSTSTSTAQNSPRLSLKNHSKQSSSELHDFESVSSITISSVAELRSVSTQTDIFGLENQLHVQYGFNRKLMEMTVAKDREIAEKVAEQVRAAKAAAEEQRQADARWAAEQEEKKRRKNASQEEAQNLALNTLFSSSSQHSFQNRTLPACFCPNSNSATHSVPTSADHSDLPVTPDDPSHFPVHFSGQQQQQQQNYQQQQQQQNYQQRQQEQNDQQQNFLNQNNRPLLPNYQQTRERNYHPQAVISPPLSPADNSNEGNSNGRGHHPHHHPQHSNSSNTSNANNNNNISSSMLSPQSSPSSSSVQLRHPKHPKQTPAKPERPSSFASSASSNSRTPKNTSSNLNRNSSHVHSSIYSRGQFDVLEAQQNSLAGGSFSPQNSTKISSTSSSEAIQRTPIDFEYNKQQVELSLTGGRGGKGSTKGGRQRESPSPRPSQPPPPVPLSAVPTDDHRDYLDGNDNFQTAKNAKIAQNIITTLNNNNNNSNEDQSQRTAQHQHHQHQLPPSTDGSGVNDGNGNGNSNDNAGDGDPQTASEKLRQLELIREHHKQNSGRAGYTDDEQLRNRILIARLLAELSYEKNKNLRQTTQDYI